MPTIQRLTSDMWSVINCRCISSACLYASNSSAVENKVDHSIRNGTKPSEQGDTWSCMGSHIHRGCPPSDIDGTSPNWMWQMMVGLTNTSRWVPFLICTQTKWHQTPKINRSITKKPKHKKLGIPTEMGTSQYVSWAYTIVAILQLRPYQNNMQHK